MPYPESGKTCATIRMCGCRCSVKDDFPLDPKAPRTQLALRYTAQGSSDRNDMQILQSSFSSPIGGDPLQAEGIRFTCILELAVGAGALRLASTDPTVQPHLDYRYLEDPWDRQRLREAVRLCARLLEHEAYQDIVAERLEPSDQDLASDEALDDWLLHHVTTTQHISGTCKMGPASDPLAVVDQHCRVHGLDRTARRRRLGHAGCDSGQYQRHDHYDCGARGRFHAPGSLSAAHGSYPRQFGEGEHGVLAGGIVPKTLALLLQQSTQLGQVA